MKSKKRKVIMIWVFIAVLLIGFLSYKFYFRDKIQENKINKSIREQIDAENLIPLEYNLVFHKLYYGYYMIHVYCSEFYTLDEDKQLKAVKSLRDIILNSNQLLGYGEVYSNGTWYTDGGDYVDKISSDEMNHMLDNSSNGKSDDRLSAVWETAKEAVEDKLKAPSTAKFCSSYSDPDVEITQLGDTYTVKSYVEAENSFGAQIRNEFTVKVSRNTDGNYTVTECSIY